MIRVGERFKLQESHSNLYGTIRKGQWVEILEASGPAGNFCTIKACSNGLVIKGAILGGVGR